MRNQYLKLFIIAGGAWSLLMIGHEIIGHGLAVLLVGGKPLGVDAMYFNHDLSGVSVAGERWVRAGGSIFNILLALVCFLILRSKKYKGQALNYFLWVSVVINLMQSGSYIGFGRFIHPGMDWAMILDGIPNRGFWEIIELLVGLDLLALGTWVAWKYGKWFRNWGILKSNKALYWIPLFSCTFIAILSALIIPTDDRFMMIMGGVGNGFSFLFPLFILGWIKSGKTETSTHLEHQKDQWLMIIMMILIVFYLFIMSPGISFTN